VSVMACMHLAGLLLLLHIGSFCCFPKLWSFCFCSAARQCLNAAASVSRLYIVGGKMEETEVPIFLNLQVEDKVEHIFEAHMIQRMGLLVLSTLDW
jgi:hypothetical protein